MSRQVSKRFRQINKHRQLVHEAFGPIDRYERRLWIHRPLADVVFREIIDANLAKTSERHRITAKKAGSLALTLLYPEEFFINLNRSGLNHLSDLSPLVEELEEVSERHLASPAVVRVGEIRQYGNKNEPHIGIGLDYGAYQDERQQLTTAIDGFLGTKGRWGVIRPHVALARGRLGTGDYQTSLTQSLLEGLPELTVFGAAQVNEFANRGRPAKAAAQS